MTMMLINVPKTIDVEISYTTAEGRPAKRVDAFSLEDFVLASLNAPEFSKDYKTIKAAIEISEAVKGAKGTSWKVHETAHEILKGHLESPEKGYMVIVPILHQVGDYFEAIIEAKPAVEKKK